MHPVAQISQHHHQEIFVGDVKVGASQTISNNLDFSTLAYRRLSKKIRANRVASHVTSWALLFHYKQNLTPEHKRARQQRRKHLILNSQIYIIKIFDGVPKVILDWFCFILLCVCAKNLRHFLNHSDFVTRVFPRFRQFAWFYFAGIFSGSLRHFP